jgi:hypothetical protein
VELIAVCGVRAAAGRSTLVRRGCAAEHARAQSSQIAFRGGLRNVLEGSARAARVLAPLAHALCAFLQRLLRRGCGAARAGALAAQILSQPPRAPAAARTQICTLTLLAAAGSHGHMQARWCAHRKVRRTACDC